MKQEDITIKRLVLGLEDLNRKSDSDLIIQGEAGAIPLKYFKPSVIDAIKTSDIVTFEDGIKYRLIRIFKSE